MDGTTLFFSMREAVIVWLIVADLMFATSYKKRTRFIFRAIVASLICMLITAGIAYIDLILVREIHSHNANFDLFYPLLNFISHILIYALNGFFLWFCYQERTVTLLFACIASYSTQTIAMLLNNTLVVFYPSLKFLSRNPVTVSSFLFWIFCYAVVYISIYFAFARTIEQDKSVAESNSPSTLVLFICVLIVAVVVRSISSSFNTESQVLFVLMNIAVICCCLIVLYVQFLLTKQMVNKRETESLLHMKDLRLKQYEYIKESIDIINEKCHDLKHQLLSVKGNGSIDQNYLREISESIDIYDTMVNTGNRALDTVITDKKLLCSKKRIDITVIADGSKLSFMSNADIYSLFGNALDNAIEYLSTVKEEKRKLKVNVSGQGSMVSIVIRNYYEGKPITDEKSLMTTKDDKAWHGFGIKSIKKIAESYGGTFTVRTENESFILGILIVKK